MKQRRKNNFLFRWDPRFSARMFAPIAAFATLCIGSTLTAQLVKAQPGTDGIETPLNQVVTPAGHKIDLPGMRPQVLVLTPNGKWLITSGKTNKLSAEPAPELLPQSGELAGEQFTGDQNSQRRSP